MFFQVERRLQSYFHNRIADKTDYSAMRGPWECLALYNSYGGVHYCSFPRESHHFPRKDDRFMRLQ